MENRKIPGLKRLLTKSELYLQESKEGYLLCKSHVLWNTFLKCKEPLWQEKLIQDEDFEIRLITDDHKDRYPRLWKTGCLLFSFRKSTGNSYVLGIFRILIKEGLVQLNPFLSFRVNKELTQEQHTHLKKSCATLAGCFGQLLIKDKAPVAKSFSESVEEFELNIVRVGFSSLTAVKADATTRKKRFAKRAAILTTIFQQDVSSNWSAKESHFLGKGYIPSTAEELVFKLHYISSNNNIDGIDSEVLKQVIKQYLSTRSIAVDDFLAEIYSITLGSHEMQADWYDLSRYISQSDLRVICHDILLEHNKKMQTVTSSATKLAISSAGGIFSPGAKRQTKKPPIYLYRLATKSKEEKPGLVLHFADCVSSADFLRKTDLNEHKSIYQHAEHKNCVVFTTGISDQGEIKIDFPNAGILDKVVQELSNLGIKRQAKEFKVDGQQQVTVHYFNIGVSRFIGNFIIEESREVDKSNTLYFDEGHPIVRPGTCLKVDASENRVSKITGDDSFPLMDKYSEKSQCRLM